MTCTSPSRIFDLFVNFHYLIPAQQLDVALTPLKTKMLFPFLESLYCQLTTPPPAIGGAVSPPPAIGGGVSAQIKGGGTFAKGGK